MCALELVTNRETKEPAKEATEQFTQLALQRGLITITAGTFGNVIRTLMPLVISDAELNEGLDIMEAALREITLVAARLGRGVLRRLLSLRLCRRAVR